MNKKSKLLLPLFLICIVAFNGYLIYTSLSPKLPQPGGDAILYSNQCRQDLRTTIVQAIEKAQNSLHLVTFGLTDPSVLQALEDKAKSSLSMKVFYDKRGSPPIFLSNERAVGLVNKGLVHQKILIVDEKIVFIGSANMTRSSLMMHDNLVIGFYSPEIARFLLQKTPFFSGNLKTMVAGQEIDIFLLPDLHNKALLALKGLLRSSKLSIQVAMFTLTHPLLVDEIISAHKRGVKVEVYVDKKSARTVSSKAVERLQKEKVPVYTNRKLSLFHHKFILVDGRHLALGSANWTKSAFNKNNDCFVILHNLRNDQKKFMKKLERVISLEGS